MVVSTQAHPSIHLHIPKSNTNFAIVRLLTHDPKYATAYNFGPRDEDARSVAWIAETMTRYWGAGAAWKLDESPSPHEAGYLKLDASRAHTDLGWTPVLDLEHALEFLVRWYRAWQSHTDMHAFTLGQIDRYSALLLSSAGSEGVPH